MFFASETTARRAWGSVIDEPGCAALVAACALAVSCAGPTVQGTDITYGSIGMCTAPSADVFLVEVYRSTGACPCVTEGGRCELVARRCVCTDVERAEPVAFESALRSVEIEVTSGTEYCLRVRAAQTGGAASASAGACDCAAAAPDDAVVCGYTRVPIEVTGTPIELPLFCEGVDLPMGGYTRCTALVD